MGDSEQSPRWRRTIAGRRMSSIPPTIGPGLVLDGTYRLERSLGEGAMGVVYLGHDERLDRAVAIKFIQPDMIRSAGAQERFLLEARTMARVRHVHVVEIYAYGQLYQTPYFVMEYVPGSTIDEWMALRARPYLSVDEALGILDQICQGVEAIHSVGAIHRDLKPTNVLIGPAFRVCVTDLGLAKVLDTPFDRDDPDTVSGTPAYMAPEVVLGTPLPEALESRADVYSLGVLAFELLTGRLPFEHPDATDMMLAHLDELPPIPSELRADLPSVFDRVVLAALHKDPELRTPSAAAFRRALSDARQAASRTNAPLRIVVADDDPDFLRLATETLTFAFPAADVEPVQDGTAALAAVDREPPSLAILDLDMPDFNGVELTAAFRASKRAANMRIVVVTATGGAPDWQILNGLGADGFLVKPIDPESLIALTRRTLDLED
jgi:serine/threonine protein kinase